MAANKPKKSAKSKNKTKNAVKSEKTVKPEVVAEEKKVAKIEKNEKAEKKAVESKPEKTEKVKEEKSSLKDFFRVLFAKKSDSKENILTIFHDKKIYGALLGEIFGTMFLSIVFLTLGVYQPLYMFFVLIGAILLTFGLSGANLNPVITAGMMATRRMSAIRGVLYILAQVLGAWIGFLIVSAFVAAGDGIAELPVMADVESEVFWVTTFIEFFGSALIGLGFARALQFKRSALTFAMVVAGITTLSFIAVIVISSSFVNLSSNFIMNPAIALMYQILPSDGGSFGELLQGVALALVTYVVFPALGGIVGFYLSDVASVFSGERLDM